MLPTLLTVNPMRKRRKHNRVRHARRHTARKTNRLHARRRAMNPHRRKHNRFHRRHRNPITATRQEVTSMLVPAGIGAVSAVGLDVIMAYLPLPAAIQTGWGNILAKAAGAVGIGILAGMLTSKRTGLLVGTGALTVVGYEAVKTALAPTLGASIKGLSGLADFADFQSVGVGAYMPRQGVGAYMSPAPMLAAPAAAAPANSLRAKQVAGLGAYMSRSRAG